MRTLSSRTLLPLVGLLALGAGAMAAGTARAAATPTAVATAVATPRASVIPTAVGIQPVTLTLDDKVQAQGLSQAAAITRAASLARFKLKVVSGSGIPAGMKLQKINVQARGGAYSSLVTFWYARGANRYGFRFTEQLLGKSLPDMSGRPTKVGKTTVYVATSFSYVNLTWSDGKLQYSLNNVTTRAADVNLKGLLAIVGKVA